jgi:hypothetical protein
MAKILPAKEINDKRYDHANDQASDNREVKRKALALDYDVSRQMAKPGKFAGQREDHAQHKQKETEKN